MTTPARLSASLPLAQNKYDEQNERQFRAQIETALRTIQVSASSDLPWFDVTDPAYGASPGVSSDQSAAFQLANDAATAAGGGVVFIPAGAYVIESDVSMDRVNTVVGQGMSLSRLVSTSDAKFKIAGFSASVDEGHLVSGLTFDGVQLRYGDSSSDLGQGVVTAYCQFVNCTGQPALYYGETAFHTTVMGCRFRLNTTCVYFAFAEVGSGSGAFMSFTDCIFADSTNSLYINGNTADGHAIAVENCSFDHVRRCVKTVSSGEGWISLKNVHIELIGYNENGDYSSTDGYFIENDGSNVWLDGFWALSGTENGWVYSKSGNIFIQNGRGTWDTDHFALMEGGQVVVDQAALFSAGRFWGESEQRMAVSGSTGGTIVAPRTAFVGHVNVSGYSVNNATPNAPPIVAGEAFDANDRIWEFDVVSFADGTDNTVRAEYQDGTHTVRCDFAFPNVAGVAHVRLCLEKGAWFAGSAVYAPSGAAGNSLGVFQIDNDDSDPELARLLQLSSIKAGATAATMAFRNFTETIVGPHVTGL